MKVTFEWPIKTLSGKSHDGKYVYCEYKDSSVCIMRKYVKPRITDHNREYGSKFQKIARLYREMPEEFKDSLRAYAQAYNRYLLPEKKLPLNFYNILVKALCNKNVSLSDLDSLENIVTKFGSTIAEWIEYGLLDDIRMGNRRNVRRGGLSTHPCLNVDIRLGRLSTYSQSEGVFRAG